MFFILSLSCSSFGFVLSLSAFKKNQNPFNEFLLHLGLQARMKDLHLMLIFTYDPLINNEEKTEQKGSKLPLLSKNNISVFNKRNIMMMS
jgi:hypothetical protein